MILGIVGEIGAGKSTLARLMAERDTAANWQLKSFAAKLKQAACIITGHDYTLRETKDTEVLPGITGRHLLQVLGTDLARKYLHEDIWVNALMKDYTADQNWLIDDVRFKNEAEAIKSRGGAVIRLVRPENPYNPLRKSPFDPIPVDAHESETQFFFTDLTVYNNGDQAQLKSLADGLNALYARYAR